MISASFQRKLVVAMIWTLFLGAAWSIPVIDYIRGEQERARMESGHYYRPGMPPSWYVRG